MTRLMGSAPLLCYILIALPVKYVLCSWALFDITLLFFFTDTHQLLEQLLLCKLLAIE